MKKYQIFLKKWQKDHEKLLRQAGTKRSRGRIHGLMEKLRT
jgi:hypothetical protein